MPIINPGQGGGSSIPTVRVLPEGYEYRKTINGDLQLYKVDVSPEVLITSANIGKFDVNGSLRAAINTIYLEDAHSIKSSGEEIVFKNLESNIFYTPVWQFTSENGQSVGQTSILVEAPTSTDYYQNGNSITAGTSVECIDTYTTTSNGSVYQFSAVASENYSGKLSLELRNSLGNAVFRLDKNVTLSVGDSIVFDKLLYRVRVGNVRTFTLLKNDGTPMMVRGGLDPLKPWVKVIYRGFADRKVIHADETGKISTSDLPQIDTIERKTVTNEAARLALPITTLFRIVIQSDNQHQYYLDPNADPSVAANWTDVGSVAAAVIAFNGRTGDVVAQTGDYTAAQVGAVAAPANDGARRVLLGNIPSIENIIDDLVTDSAAQPLSARQGKLLNDTKQENITGGASSITSTNLSSNRALSSDVSGKVVASAVTSSELGQLSGATSNIQAQLDSKQPTVTGTASSITSTELTADRVMIVDGLKKAAASNITTTELSQLSGVTSSIQTQLNSKQATISGAASTVVSSNLLADKVVVTDVAGKIVADPSITVTELGYVGGVTSSIQTQLNSKQSTITGAASTVTSTNLTANRVAVSDASGKISASATVDTTELGYLDGVTSAIQAQIDSKQPTITGTASTITTTNLTGNRVVVTNPGGKAAASSVTTTELDYLVGTTSAVQTQINGKQATITGGATTITATNLTASRALSSDGSGKVAVSATTSTELGFLSGTTSSVQTQLNGKQATITGGATTITSANLTANRVLVSDASGKVAVDANIDTTELSYLNGVTSNIQTQLNDGWFARNTSNTLNADKMVVDMVPIASANGTITPAMIPWSMPTTTNGRAYQFAWMLNRVGALIGSLDNDRSYDGLFSTLLASSASDSTLMKTAWPSLGSIDVDQASSASVPPEAFKMVIGRDASSIYWVNTVGWFNAADDRGIRYETSSNVWGNAQDGTFPLIRSSTSLVSGAATFSDNLINASWPALCVIPIRLELF